MRFKKTFDSGEFDSFFKQNFKSLKCSAFTLTEVLLAVTIVGIIAALVLPATVSKFNDNILNTAHTRIKESVQNALDSLVVTENKTSFFTTSMYSLTEPENYENSSGKFLKRNFRVSKYCGSSGAECFSKEYYTTNGTKREIYTPKYEGSCAILKSGASICIAPQIGLDKPVRGIVDVNGIKGPNVFGRDLRSFALEMKYRQTKLAEVEEVNLTPNPKLEEVEEPPPPPPDPCEENPTGLECCKTYPTLEKGHACCAHSAMQSLHEACRVKKVSYYVSAKLNDTSGSDCGRRYCGYAQFTCKGSEEDCQNPPDMYIEILVPTQGVYNVEGTMRATVKSSTSNSSQTIWLNGNSNALLTYVPVSFPGETYGGKTRGTKFILYSKGVKKSEKETSCNGSTCYCNLSATFDYEL